MDGWVGVIGTYMGTLFSRIKEDICETDFGNVYNVEDGHYLVRKEIRGGRYPVDL